MDSKKSKILTIITAIIGLIGVFFLLRIIMVGDEAVETSADVQSGIVDPFITFSYVLLIITTIITLLLSVVNLIKHPQALKKTLMGVGVLIILLVVSYFMASGDPVTNSGGDIIEIKDSMGKILTGDEAASISKWVSALITFSAILGTIGLGTIGAGFVKSLIK